MRGRVGKVATPGRFVRRAGARPAGAATRTSALESFRPRLVTVTRTRPRRPARSVPRTRTFTGRGVTRGDVAQDEGGRARAPLDGLAHEPRGQLEVGAAGDHQHVVLALVDHGP